MLYWFVSAQWLVQKTFFSHYCIGFRSLGIHFKGSSHFLSPHPATYSVQLSLLICLDLINGCRFFTLLQQHIKIRHNDGLSSAIQNVMGSNAIIAPLKVFSATFPIRAHNSECCQPAGATRINLCSGRDSKPRRQRCTNPFEGHSSDGVDKKYF